MAILGPLQHRLCLGLAAYLLLLVQDVVGSGQSCTGCSKETNIKRQVHPRFNDTWMYPWRDYEKNITYPAVYLGKSDEYHTTNKAKWSETWTAGYYDVSLLEELADQVFGRDPLSNYSPELFPSIADENMFVGIQFKPLDLVELDDVTQTFTIVGRLTLMWHDPRLVWEGKYDDKFKKIGAFHVDPAGIWTPDITLRNGVEQTNLKECTEKATIWKDGTVAWHPTVTYVAKCNLKLEYYPFDIQMCYLKLGSSTYSRNFMDLDVWDSEVDRSQLQNRNFWKIIHAPITYNMMTYDTTTNNYADAKFFFILKRNYFQFLINISLVCFILCFIAIQSFHMPICSGERLGASLSVVIAITVYQLIALDSIPTGTDCVPVGQRYLGGLFILINMSVISVMNNIKIYFATDMKAPGEWHFSFVRWLGYKLGECHCMEYYTYAAVKNYVKGRRAGTNLLETSSRHTIKRNKSEMEVDPENIPEIFNPRKKSLLPKMLTGLLKSHKIEEKLVEEKAKKIINYIMKKRGEDWEEMNSLELNLLLCDVQYDLISYTKDYIYSYLYTFILLWITIYTHSFMFYDHHQIDHHFEKLEEIRFT